MFVQLKRPFVEDPFGESMLHGYSRKAPFNGITPELLIVGIVEIL
jgi:hypothetical protein